MRGEIVSRRREFHSSDGRKYFSRAAKQPCVFEKIDLRHLRRLFECDEDVSAGKIRPTEHAREKRVSAFFTTFRHFERKKKKAPLWRGTAAAERGLHNESAAF